MRTSNSLPVTRLSAVPSAFLNVAVIVVVPDGIVNAPLGAPVVLSIVIELHRP